MLSHSQTPREPGDRKWQATAGSCKCLRWTSPAWSFQQQEENPPSESRRKRNTGEMRRCILYRGRHRSKFHLKKSIVFAVSGSAVSFLGFYSSWKVNVDFVFWSACSWMNFILLSLTVAGFSVSEQSLCVSLCCWWYSIYQMSFRSLQQSWIVLHLNIFPSESFILWTYSYATI